MDPGSKLLKNKKGQENRTINGILFAIIFFLFALAIVTGVWRYLRGVPEQLACEVTIQKNIDQRLPLDVQNIQYLINCPSKYVLFSKDGYLWGYEQDELSDEEKEIYEDEKNNKCDEDDDACMFNAINKVMADEMLTCWDIFFKGERRLFSSYDTEKQCVICTVFFFDNEMKAEYGDWDEIGMYNEEYSLDEFMKNNGPRGVNYYQNELNYYQLTLDLIDEAVDMPYYDYTISKDYAVVFTALNEHYVKNNMAEELWNMILEHFGKDPVEDYGDYVNTLNFIENDEVSLYCDTLI